MNKCKLQPMQIKSGIQFTVNIFAMFGLLAYTLWHTGGLLAAHIDPPSLGYICAAGVELMVISLSFRISDIRRKGRNAAFYWSVLGAVVVISMIANFVMGYQTRFGQELTAASIKLLDWVQWVIGASSTALISLVVFASAEIVGTTFDAIFGADESDEDKTFIIERQQAELMQAEETIHQLQTANKVWTLLSASARSELTALACDRAQEPRLKVKLLAANLDVTETTVRGGYKKAGDNGR